LDEPIAFYPTTSGSGALSKLAEHLLFVAALQPIVAPLGVDSARPQIVKLQAAEPAMIKLATQQTVDEVKDAAAHAINLIDALLHFNVLMTAFRTFGKARQSQTRKNGDVIASAATVAAVGFEVTQPIDKATPGTM
jgi:hypothetical protein